MKYDVIIIGAGPAGLASAIRFKQLCKEQNKDFSVCVLEKGAEVGSHILSGAILEPNVLDELLPDWKDCDQEFQKTPVSCEKFLFLTSKRSIRLPLPPQLHNQGNYVVSLGSLCKYLARQAEILGVEIYPGFAATKMLFDEGGNVIGVKTGPVGIDKNGVKTANYQDGMEILSKQTVMAEGCRGSLTKMLFERFKLRDGVSPQTYGIGLKEIWRVSPKTHVPGKIIHTIGSPLNRKTYGGGFLYHLENNHVAVGLIIGLDYKNPFLSPYDEFQKLKIHPVISSTLQGGERIAYGARTISEGGFQSIPKLVFPGGLFIGDSAGFLNVPKIKGIHTAMQSGILAAETIFEQFQKKEITYESKLKKSSLWKELYRARNIRPAFKYGLMPGLIYAAIDTYILRGCAPWTFKNHADHLALKYKSKKIDYPKPDGKITFDIMSSVYLSNISHNENQPNHLQLKDFNKAIDINYQIYGSPEQYYCPAKVYEIISEEDNPRLQINAQNCIHCKTCDIKDPTQNINWVPPEGGDGPNYSGM